MPWRSRLSPKSIFLTLSVLLLVLVIACGDAAPATTATEASGMAGERKQAEAAASETGGAEPTPTLFIEVVTRLPATPVPFGDATPTAIPALAPVSEATYGGTLPLHAYTAPTTARPLPEATHSGMISLSPLYNQMVEYNPETDDTLDLRCDLCKTWEISEDGLTRTYHLYEEARWSDGEPLNAEDIIFSIDAIVDPDDPQVRRLMERPQRTRSLRDVGTLLRKFSRRRRLHGRDQAQVPFPGLSLRPWNGASEDDARARGDERSSANLRGF